MLRRALESVAAQTMKDLVWVIVNDGGEQGPVDEVAALGRGRGLDLAVIHRISGEGMEAAANAGVRQTTSSYVAIHDDDDSWEPRFLGATTALLDQTPDYVGAVTSVTTVTERIDAAGIVELRRDARPLKAKAIHLADMARANLFPPISFLYRRDLFDRLGGYDETMRVLGDWDFNLRALLIGDIALIAEALANYHVRPKLGDKQDGYANSVIAEVNVHHEVDAAFRNRLIRDDIAKGKFGLGVLVALARMQSQAAGRRGIDIRKTLTGLWGQAR
jgi:glycosyltransferase involved in cell wall biosynthesis